MIRLLLLFVLLVAGCVFLVRLVEQRRRERLAHVRASFLAGLPAAQEHGPVLKDVALRSGAVRMGIPRHWAEEYPDEDHASFHDPGSAPRVLRLASARVSGVAGDLKALLQARAGDGATTIEDLTDGRVLLRALDASRENGRDVVVFRWLCAARQQPSEVRLATFTLSVPERLALDPLTRDVVATLDLEIRSAQLA